MSRNATNTEKADAIARLQEILKPGDTVYCLLRSVSKSGMSRTMSFYGANYEFLDGYISNALGLRRVPMGKGEGLKVSGCGMDMGFRVVYKLGHALFGAGFGCIGRACPSNDHTNGDHDYTPHNDGTPKTSEEVGKDLPTYRHYHTDGGYALKHHWL